MKQLLQDLSKGATTLVESPAPKITPNSVLINTSITLISSGTERMLVDFGKANLISKARQQPEKVKMVLEKAKTDGVLTTIDAVRSKLTQPLPLGYCNVGVVSGVGAGAEGFKVGDRVVSNGSHADVVRVGKNLCAKIPDNVADDQAAFTVMASIGLQGIRLAQPTLGESFVVIGVGLIGLLAVQLLRANGCRVLAIDFDDQKLELAKSFGAIVCNPAKGEDPVAAGIAFSRGPGVDGVIITASTQSNDPVSQAARISRKRGRIVLVGVTGLELNRSEFYEKELSFQVSCSYGPGRYDSDYEDKGQDYPIGFVRWTEQRNFQAVLDMMDSGVLSVEPLITHRFSFDDAPAAYELLTKDKSAFGILLEYTSPNSSRHSPIVVVDQTPRNYQPTKPVVGFIGAGNYASRVLIPSFKQANAALHCISSSGGISGVISAKKYNFAEATTDTEALFSHELINTIVVATRHDTHTNLVEKALNSGKHVFVEKPLAMSYEEISRLETSYKNSEKQATSPLLMVGFNRRFSPHVQKIKELLSVINEPKSFIMTMNAGAIPDDHWTQDPAVGGGRIIGEACHYIDLMRYLADVKIVSVQARRMGDNPTTTVTEDKAVIVLGFEDGSFGTIHYLANGANSYPKETVEVFAAGRVLKLDNFRKLNAYGWPDFKKMNLWQQDKGQNECVSRFLDAVEKGHPAPIPSDEIFEVASISIQAAHLLRAQN